MRTRLNSLLIVLSACVLFGTSEPTYAWCFFFCDESEQAAEELVEQAQLHFRNKEYQIVISKISDALELMDSEESERPVFNGTALFIRGQANAALDNHEEAILDFQEAVEMGWLYANSYALLSNPKPMAVPKYLKIFSFYFSNLGKSNAAFGKCNEARDAYLGAINIANQALNHSSELLANLAGGKEFRREFYPHIGSFYFSLALLPHRIQPSGPE